ncbi:MAG: LacI family transcriptional regulator, partial [Lachnospiraceae bacterium]|nr:LacI family transcriptional regulator [Lachnospiraceae bacterium]
MKKAGINEIADALEISPTTASRALSGNGRVSSDTRRRVMEYIANNDIEPNIRQRKTQKKKSGNIAVTVPQENDYALLPFFNETISSIYDYYSVYDYQIIYAKTREDDISALKKIVEQHKAEGIILTRIFSNAQDIKYLQEKNVPFVAIGSYDDKRVYQVDVDQQAGCRDLTSVLLRMGIRDIALFCADMTHMVTKNRMKGFLQAYEENGLDFNPVMIFDNVENPYVVERITKDMLKQGVECILCMDDNICISVLNILRRNGVRVPQDIKIASFYNSQVLNEYYPPISCVDFDIKELGVMAAKTLIDLLQGKELSLIHK